MIGLEHYEIIDKLIELKNQYGWSYYKIAQESQLPESTVAHIYNRKSLPQIDTLNSLCKGFNITLEQFFTEDEKYKQLSDEEKEVLKLWNALDSENKKLAKDLMKRLNLK